MFKQITVEYNSTLATPTSDWFPFDVAGYDSIVIQLVSNQGWDGTLSFWAGPRPAVDTAGALWSLNDAEDSSLTAQVESVVGSTPSYFAKNYRGSVAGCKTFGIYFANPTTFAPISGIVTAYVGLYTSAK